MISWNTLPSDEEEERKFQSQFTVQYNDSGQKQIIAVQSHSDGSEKTTEKGNLTQWVECQTVYFVLTLSADRR